MVSSALGDIMLRMFTGIAALLILTSCDQPGRSGVRSNSDLAAPPTLVPVGNHAIIHSPQVERDTMLLDTVTGDTWQLVKIGKTDNSGMGWEFVPKIDQPPSPPPPPTIQTTN